MSDEANVARLADLLGNLAEAEGLGTVAACEALARVLDTIGVFAPPPGVIIHYGRSVDVDLATNPWAGAEVTSLGDGSPLVTLNGQDVTAAYFEWMEAQPGTSHRAYEWRDDDAQ